MQPGPRPMLPVRGVCERHGHLIPTVNHPESNDLILPVTCPLVGMDPRGPLPPGVSIMPVQKQRVPPPPGEDSREVHAVTADISLQIYVPRTFSVAPDLVDEASRVLCVLPRPGRGMS